MGTSEFARGDAIVYVLAYMLAFPYNTCTCIRVFVYACMLVFAYITHAYAFVCICIGKRAYIC